MGFTRERHVLISTFNVVTECLQPNSQTTSSSAPCSNRCTSNLPITPRVVAPYPPILQPTTFPMGLMPRNFPIVPFTSLPTSSSARICTQANSHSNTRPWVRSTPIMEALSPRHQHPQLRRTVESCWTTGRILPQGNTNTSWWQTESFPTRRRGCRSSQLPAVTYPAPSSVIQAHLTPENRRGG